MNAKTRNKLDAIFSKYIRLRDADEYGMVKCITCDNRKPVKEMQCGHFISRRHYATRWDEQNTAGQCPACNLFAQGRQYEFSLALIEKYDKDTPQKLLNKSKDVFKLSEKDAQTLIHEYKKKVERLRQQKGL